MFLLIEQLLNGLQFGLLLFPWAFLYGVTAFLFNHPTVFSDQPTATFGREVLTGTPLESIPTPTEQATLVVARWRGGMQRGDHKSRPLQQQCRGTFRLG